MELQADARNLEMKKLWQDKIDEEKERLERHHPGIVQHLRVTIEGTKSHREGGYEVKVVAAVPSDTVVVKRKGEKVMPLLVEAFNTLGQQLKEIQRKKRQTTKAQEDIKPHEAEGVVKTLFVDEAYGFISSQEGNEVYFNESALKNISINDLKVGDGVKFAENMGDQGPCAVWVKTL